MMSLTPREMSGWSLDNQHAYYEKRVWSWEAELKWANWRGVWFTGWIHRELNRAQQHLGEFVIQHTEFSNRSIEKIENAKIGVYSRDKKAMILFDVDWVALQHVELYDSHDPNWESPLILGKGLGKNLAWIQNHTTYEFEVGLAQYNQAKGRRTWLWVGLALVGLIVAVKLVSRRLGESQPPASSGGTLSGEIPSPTLLWLVDQV